MYRLAHCTDHVPIDTPDLKGCGVSVLPSRKATGGDRVHNGKDHENDDCVDKSGIWKLDHVSIEHLRECELQQLQC